MERSVLLDNELREWDELGKTKWYGNPDREITPNLLRRPASSCSEQCSCQKVKQPHLLLRMRALR